MESGAKQGEENIGFKRPEHEIEEMVKRFPETASRGDCLDFVHVLDLVFLFLCKQAEFFNLHCMMRIKSDFFFHNILQPAYADWMKNHPDFFGNHPWEKLPNGQNPAIFYGEQMPAFLEKETLGAGETAGPAPSRGAELRTFLVRTPAYPTAGTMSCAFWNLMTAFRVKE